jgi:hypothetical protein
MTILNIMKNLPNTVLRTINIYTIPLNTNIITNSRI